MKKRILCLVLSVCLTAGLCLCFAPSASAYQTGYPNTYTNTGNQRSDVVAIAQTQLGYPYDGGTKYGAWWTEANGYGYDFTREAWCAMFILWCEAQAGCTAGYQGGSAHCATWLSSFRNGKNGNSAQRFGSGYMPRPGDIVFVGYDGYSTDHVGLVTAVSGDTIYTIEGNYSKKVSAVAYSLSTGYRIGGLKKILYFGIPAYTNDSSGSFDGPITTDPDTKIDETAVNYTGTITASTLNVRTSPSTSASVQSTLAKGASVTIVAECTAANGTKWGRLEGGGWISLAYVQQGAGETPEPPAAPEAPTTPDATLYEGTVSCDILNVRASASTGAAVSGTLRKGDKLAIVEETTAGGLTWGRLSSGGWVATKYVTKSGSAETPTTPEAPGETVSYTATVTASALNVRSTPATGSVVNVLRKGASVTITAEQDGWGKLEGGGWVSLTYISKSSDSGATGGDPGSSGGTGSTGSTQPASISGTITASALNVRETPGTGRVVSTLYRGSTVTVTETTTVGSTTWGKTASGWISMDYVSTASAGGSTGGSETGNPGTTAPAGSAAAGTVTASVLNVRATPGTGSVVGAVYRGDTVSVTETTTVGSTVWGRISAGWISMDYVSTGSGSSTGGSGGTKTVTITGDVVNVRSAAGTGNGVIGVVSRGTTCTIVATATAGGTTWGQLASGGWICMDYAA